MIVYDFLKKVDLFAELSEDDLREICADGTEVVLADGESYKTLKAVKTIIVYGTVEFKIGCYPACG